jgi:hypothetical protein
MLLGINQCERYSKRDLILFLYICCSTHQKISSTPLELSGQCGIIELSGQCGILELSGQCGIVLLFILLLFEEEEFL